MSVLIVYRTKYGCTAACCRALAERIRTETVVVDLATQRVPEVERFDVVVIGGSIYGGKIQREVGSFCDRQAKRLRTGRVGLFICCLYDGEHAKVQLQTAFPDWLMAHAFATGLFGGELRYRELTLLDRLLVRSVSPVSGDVRRLRPDAVQAMADAVNSVSR